MKISKFATLCLAACLGAIAGVPQASAQTFRKIYDFDGAVEGGLVSAELVVDANGVFYGVTGVGGPTSPAASSSSHRAHRAHLRISTVSGARS